MGSFRKFPIRGSNPFTYHFRSSQKRRALQQRMTGLLQLSLVKTKTPCRTFSATFNEEGQIDCATKSVLKTDEAKSPWGFESLSFRQSITPGCCADGYTRQLWELNFAGSNPVTQTIYFLIMRGSVQSTSGS